MLEPGEMAVDADDGGCKTIGALRAGEPDAKLRTLLSTLGDFANAGKNRCHTR